MQGGSRRGYRVAVDVGGSKCGLTHALTGWVTGCAAKDAGCDRAEGGREARCRVAVDVGAGWQ